MNTSFLAVNQKMKAATDSNKKCQFTSAFFHDKTKSVSGPAYNESERGGSSCTMKKLGKWLDENLEGTILMVLLAAFSCVMMLQVIMRYAFGNALPWAEEVCRYCFVYSAFLSVPYTAKKGLGIRVDVLYRLFPKALQKLLNYFYEILQIAFYGYLAYSSIDVIKNVAASGALSTALRIPMQWIYIIIPIGFGLGVIRLIQRFVYLLTHKGEAMKQESRSVLEEEE